MYGRLEGSQPIAEEDGDAGPWLLATAMSGKPSWLASRTMTHCGPVPVGSASMGWNVPFPFPKAMETVEAVELATARSGRPSAFRSAAAMEVGPALVGRVVAG